MKHMVKMEWLVTLGLVVAMAAGSASAANDLEAEPPTLSTQAREFIEETAEIKAKYWLSEGIFALIVETVDGHGMTLFADSSGRFLMSGAVIDSQTGENVAEEITKRHFPEPGPGEMYGEAEAMHWVSTGESGRGDPIYVVADLQCGYCHQMAREIAARGIRREIRWILVGFGGNISMKQAAGIFAVQDLDQRQQALWALLTGQATGVPPQISAENVGMVGANEIWAERWRITGTPVSLIPYEGRIHRVIGLPNRALWDIIAQDET